MSGDAHVRFCERLGVRFPWATRLVACFEYQDEANAFLEQLSERVTGFGLELAKEKTRCIEFGRFARNTAYRRGEKPKEFTFLGFTHYCGKTRRGYFKVKRRTIRKKLGQSLNELSDWARRARSFLRKGEMLRRAKVRIQGHLNYYAITDNAKACYRYVHHAQSILFKWLNRKSQRRAYTWAGFYHALAAVGWPRVRIHTDLNPHRRAEAH